MPVSRLRLGWNAPRLDGVLVIALTLITVRAYNYVDSRPAESCACAAMEANISQQV